MHSSRHHAISNPSYTGWIFKPSFYRRLFYQTRNVVCCSVINVDVVHDVDTKLDAEWESFGKHRMMKSKYLIKMSKCIFHPYRCECCESRMYLRVYTFRLVCWMGLMTVHTQVEQIASGKCKPDIIAENKIIKYTLHNFSAFRKHQIRYI